MIISEVDETDSENEEREYVAPYRHTLDDAENSIQG